MGDKEYFKVIDIAIDNFNADKAYTIEKEPQSDWLVFDWRQLICEVDGVTRIIEIYPHFSKKEEIISWTLYAAASYDTNTHRYYLKKVFATRKTLDFITKNVKELINKAHTFLMSVNKIDIPKALRLENS